MSPADARRALNAFVAQNPELKRLEDILSQFNLFEAVGIVRHELRHSNLLAFLLDPGQNHGLGDAFLKQFLQEVSADDFDGWSFAAIDVRREWRNIDILLLDDSRRFALLIENKIDTGEHSDQLKNYYEIAQSGWSDYDLRALYLTPGGDEPSHPDYLAVDYGAVCRAVEAVAQNLPPRLDAGVHLLLTHYAQMLKRHIMTDTEVADLCRRIYAKHRRALDLIYEHRPDRRSEIADIALRLLQNDPDWLYDGQRGTTWANCRPVQWKNNRFLIQSFCQLLFSESELTFTINIWNGNANSLKERSRLWDMARRFGWPVKPLKSGNNQTEIYRCTIFKSTQSETDDAFDLETSVQRGWADFVGSHYPPIREALSREAWLWDPSAVTPPLPVSQFGIGDFAKRLVDANAKLIFYHTGKRYVVFGLKEWDEAARSQHNKTHNDGSWQLFFSFENDPNKLEVCLQIQPGDQSDRERLFAMAQRHHFQGCSQKLTKWCRLSTIPILSASDYSKTQEEVETLISEKWEAFLRDELPRMAQAIRDEQWLWDPSAVLPSLPVSRHDIREFVRRLIVETPGLWLYNDGPGFVNFGMHEWNVPSNYRWGHNNGFWLVHFNFVNNPADLTICLGVEPGDETDRNTLLQIVQGHGFTGTRSTKLQRGWSALTSFPVLSANDYGKTQKEAEALISEKWATYLRDELPRIVQAIRD